MDLPPDFKMTTEMLWQGTLMFVLLNKGWEYLRGKIKLGIEDKR